MRLAFDKPLPASKNCSIFVLSDDIEAALSELRLSRRTATPPVRPERADRRRVVDCLEGGLSMVRLTMQDEVSGMRAALAPGGTETRLNLLESLDSGAEPLADWVAGSGAPRGKRQDCGASL